MKSKLIAFIGILAAAALSTAGWAKMEKTAGAFDITVDGDPDATFGKYYIIHFFQPAAYDPQTHKPSSSAMEECHTFTRGPQSFPFWSGETSAACKKGNISKIYFEGINNAQSFDVNMKNWQDLEATKSTSCSLSLELKKEGDRYIAYISGLTSGKCSVEKK